MLSETLQQLIDQNLTSAKEIGELTGKASSTVYRWTSGQSQPDFHSIRLLVRHLPSVRAQQGILSAFTAGTPWTVQYDEANLDVNDDGRVDTEDALDAAVMAVRDAGLSMSKVRQATRDGRITVDEAIGAMALLDRVVSECNIARRVLVEICEQQQLRRKKLRIAE